MRILFVKQIAKVLGELYVQPMKGMHALQILDVLEEIQPEVEKVTKITNKILEKYAVKDEAGKPTSEGLTEENHIKANDEYLETMLSKKDIELKFSIKMEIIENLEIKGTDLSLLLEEKIVTREKEEEKEEKNK